MTRLWLDPPLRLTRLWLDAPLRLTRLWLDPPLRLTRLWSAGARVNRQGQRSPRCQFMDTGTLLLSQ